MWREHAREQHLANEAQGLGHQLLRIDAGLDVVTDVGSVKAELVETLPGLLPEGVHYVGSHPMLQSLDLSGMEVIGGALMISTDATLSNGGIQTPSLVDYLR